MPLPTTGAGASAIGLPWWNPDGNTPSTAVGGSCVAAYRAIDTPGSPWGAGPVNYAASMANLANPGTYDLTEINGVVPWAGVTGWGFVRAQQKSFDTNIVPILDQTWSVLYQYSGLVFILNTYWLGMYDTGPPNRGTIAFQMAAAAVTTRFGDVAISVNNAPIAPVAANIGCAGLIPYRDGAAEANPLPAGAGATELSIYIGALNVNGAAGQWVTHNGESFAIYNITLTAPQMLARAAAMAVL